MPACKVCVNQCFRPWCPYTDEPINENDWDITKNIEDDIEGEENE